MSCKTVPVVTYPEFTHPEIKLIPNKIYVDGGFSPVDSEDDKSDLIISHNDAKILGKYISDLKNWGTEGWTWVTDYYIKELEELKNSALEDN